VLVPHICEKGFAFNGCVIISNLGEQLTVCSSLGQGKTKLNLQLFFITILAGPLLYTQFYITHRFNLKLRDQYQCMWTSKIRIQKA